MLPFRSVLPHEPISPATAQADEELGHIHLQGSFTAKVVGISGRNESKARDPPNIPAGSIEAAILAFLMPSSSELLSEVSADDSALPPGPPPHEPLSVEVVDPTNPPYSRIRITYCNELAARDIVSYLRYRSVSPSHLLSGLSRPEEGGSQQWRFSSRPIQATQITRRALLSEDLCWPRSNPPKFRRLLHTQEGRAKEDADTLKQKRQSTRFLFLTNLMSDENGDLSETEKIASLLESLRFSPHCFLDTLRSLLDRFDSSGLGVEIFLQSPAKGNKWLKSVNIGMRSHRDAIRVVEEMQGASINLEVKLPGDEPSFRLQTGRLFLDFVAPTHRSWAKPKDERNSVTRSDCTSSTSHVAVPGLLVIPEFVSSEEEASLLATLIGPDAPWAPPQASKSKIGSGTVRRRVQHYGYVFDYESADVLRDRKANQAGCPPMPSGPQDPDEVEPFIKEALKEYNGWGVLAGVIQRTRMKDFEGTLYSHLNQLTVNGYKPGQGIGSHVDTPTAFGDGLISLSLSSGIVMEFREQGRDKVKNRKLVHLPPRSLCLMSGPARYEWEHMIVGRMTDTIEGVIQPRGFRLSLTFRTALAEVSKTALVPARPLPLVESSSFPLKWVNDDNNNTKEKNMKDSDISTPDTEKKHVHAVYDCIATQWHHTRGRKGVLWPGATVFLQELPKGSVVADVGCGDGKYFPAIYGAGSFVIGSDISLPLLETAVKAVKAGKQGGEEMIPESRRVDDRKAMLNARPAVAVADCMHVPLRNRSFDAAICIAVMHHLSTKARRIRCLTELARIVKLGGMINVQAWAIDQDAGSKRNFAATDVFVPFNAQPRYLDKVEGAGRRNSKSEASRGVAQMYSEAYQGAEYDERKGLVVFQRYCHLYRKGELEELADEVENVELMESGYESGNYFVILRVTS